MLKNKKTLVVVISILVILIVLATLYFVFWRERNKGVNEDRLTEEQKATIIKELTPDASSKPITANEKKQAEKDLSESSVNVEPLTESDVNTIINSLNQ